MIAFLIMLAAFGAAGAIARALLEQRFASSDPQVLSRGILLANLLGCLVLGVGTGIADINLNYLLAHGFSGALTTWSTFSLQTAELLRTGRYRLGVLNILFNVVGGWLAALLGYAVAVLIFA